jgi:hypothetical protein
MKNQQSHGTIEHVIRVQRERKRRLDAAREAERSLLPGEREEFFAVLYEEMEHAASDVARVNRVLRSGFIEAAAVQRKPTIRSVIATVLAGGVALGCGDICGAALQLDPDLRKASVASELTQMRKAGLVTKRGSGPRGGLYGLADQPANDQSRST